MKLTVTQSKLSKALNMVSRIAVGKSTLPILNNILIRVENKKVSLITTNLDMAIIDFLPVSSSEEGVITAPAKLLADFVSNLPKGSKIELKSEGTKTIVSTDKYSSTINGMVADDFPELPEINEKTAVVYKVSVDEFSTSISQVIVATSNDLTRPALTGVYFDSSKGPLNIVATDGYRLAKKELIKKVESEVSAIIPASSLHEVLRSISEDVEEVEISFNEDLVRFRLGDVEIISKLIDASYPDYTALIPKDNEVSLNLDREELIRTTKLAALFAKSIDGSIICETKQPDIFSIGAIANEYGENDSIINTPVTADCKTRLNSRFFIDALNSMQGKTVNLEFSNNVKPIVLREQKDNRYIHIIMPLNK